MVMRLTAQQRKVLAHVANNGNVRAWELDGFAVDSTWGHRHRMTESSARSVLVRLEARGLVRRQATDRGLFWITDEGRRALEES
jgi:DNA-binding MarR family transcriptional regulator